MAYPSPEQDLTCHEADDPLFLFTLYLNGTAFNLMSENAQAPYAPTLYVETQAGGTLLQTFGVGTGLVLVNSGAEGQLTFNLPVNLTTTPGVYYYRLTVTDSFANIATVCAGKVNVLAA